MTNQHVLIFSKSTNADCDASRKLVHELEQYASIVELDLQEEGDAVLEHIKEVTGEG